MKNHFKTLTLIGAPLIAMLASCATSTATKTPTPRAHRHGNLVHTHAITQTQGVDHQHESKKSATKKPAVKTTMVKVAKKKIVVPVQPAKPEDIKPMGLKGILHKHHTHIEPKTGEESVPC